jgi:hypothetical protein
VTDVSLDKFELPQRFYRLGYQSVFTRSGSNMKNLLLSVVVTLFLAGSAAAQTPVEKLAGTITAKDAAFWAAYNKCDTAAFRPMFTDDVEFYHDKGGQVAGLENFMLALKNGLCGNADSRLRREEVKDTVKVFPLTGNGVVYGAIILGEHVFYVNQKGKPEFLDGHARFMQLWLVREGEWKIATTTAMQKKS